MYTMTPFEKKHFDLLNAFHDFENDFFAGPGWNFGEHRILLFCPVVFPRCGVWNAL